MKATWVRGGGGGGEVEEGAEGAGRGGLRGKSMKDDPEKMLELFGCNIYMMVNAPFRTLIPNAHVL
jgi:hypothetical protein